MYTPRSLRARGLHETWLDPAVLLLALRGAVPPAELVERIEAAPPAVRWLVLDLAGAADVGPELPAALLGPARALRATGAELVLTGSPEALAWDDLVRLRSVDEVLMLLKAPPSPARPRSRERVEALVLPRLDPR